MLGAYQRLWFEAQQAKRNQQSNALECKLRSLGLLLEGVKDRHSGDPAVGERCRTDGFLEV